MALASVVTVYGETRGIAILYREVFWETSIEEMEQENLLISGKEYVDRESDGRDRRQKETLEQLETGLYRLDCQIKTGETWVSDEVDIQQAGKLKMSIMADSGDTDMVAGIIEPGGKICCVSGRDVIDYSFDISQTGSYQVYVKNLSKQSQEIHGTVRWVEQ